MFETCEKKQCKVLKAIANKREANKDIAFVCLDKSAPPEALNPLELVFFEIHMFEREVSIGAYSIEHDRQYELPADFNFTEENLEAWVDDLIAGQIKPAIKSEAIPEENDGPVYVVVADSWSDIVEDKTKDVVIAQLSKIPGHSVHSNKFDSVYYEVAWELRRPGIEHVKLAMIEANANDVPDEYRAHLLPTVHFFKAGEEQKGVKYDGYRSKRSIIEWIKKHTSIKFDFDTSSLGEDDQLGFEEEGYDMRGFWHRSVTLSPSVGDNKDEL